MKQRKSSDSRSRVLFYAAALTVFSFLSPLNITAENVPHVNVVQQTGLKVSGVVLDSNGEPVVSATVREVGTSNGVITDLEGRFVLTVKQGAKLQISSIGYTNKTVTAKSQITVTLEDDAAQLGETVLDIHLLGGGEDVIVVARVAVAKAVDGIVIGIHVVAVGINLVVTPLAGLVER